MPEWFSPRCRRLTLAFVLLGAFAGFPLPSPRTGNLAAQQIPGYAFAAGASLPGSEILKLTTAGKHQEACAKALARITEVKDDIDAYVSLSWSLVALRRYGEAETYALRGYELRNDPRLAQAIGEASYYLGKNDVALAMLQEYIATYPEGPRAGLSFFLCGELYVRLARFMHADIAFSAAVQHNPNNPSWWARLGWARENARKPLQALDAYEKALALNPNFADALEGKRRIQDRMRG